MFCVMWLVIASNIHDPIAGSASQSMRSKRLGSGASAGAGDAAAPAAVSGIALRRAYNADAMHSSANNA